MVASTLTRRALTFLIVETILTVATLVVLWKSIERRPLPRIDNKAEMLLPVNEPINVDLQINENIPQDITTVVPFDPSYDPDDIKAMIMETTAEVATQNQRIGQKMAVDADQMVALAKCESTWRPKQISPNGKYFGLYQWRPQDIPGGAQCALDISCSTIATIDAINKGEAWRWPTCWGKTV